MAKEQNSAAAQAVNTAVAEHNKKTKQQHLAPASTSVQQGVQPIKSGQQGMSALDGNSVTVQQGGLPTVVPRQAMSSGLDILQDGTIQDELEQPAVPSPAQTSNRLARPIFLSEEDGIAATTPHPTAAAPAAKLSAEGMFSAAAASPAGSLPTWQQPYAGAAAFISPQPSKLPQPSAAFTGITSRTGQTPSASFNGLPAHLQQQQPPDTMQVSPQLFSGQRRQSMAALGQHLQHPAAAPGVGGESLDRLLAGQLVQQQQQSPADHQLSSALLGDQQQQQQRPVSGLAPGRSSPYLAAVVGSDHHHMPPPPSGLPIESRLLSNTSLGMLSILMCL